MAARTEGGAPPEEPRPSFARTLTLVDVNGAPTGPAEDPRETSIFLLSRAFLDDTEIVLMRTGVAPAVMVEARGLGEPLVAYLRLPKDDVQVEYGWHAYGPGERVDRPGTVTKVDDDGTQHVLHVEWIAVRGQRVLVPDRPVQYESGPVALAPEAVVLPVAVGAVRTLPADSPDIPGN